MIKHDELLEKYKNGEYIIIKEERELRNYWNSEKHTICVLRRENKKDRVFVKQRKDDYDWMMYKHVKTKKVEMLLPDAKMDSWHGDHAHFSTIKSFDPPHEIVNELKQKKEMGYKLTKEEESAIRRSKFGITDWLFIIAAIYIVLRYVYLLFC